MMNILKNFNKIIVDYTYKILIIEVTLNQYIIWLNSVFKWVENKLLINSWKNDTINLKYA